MFEDYIKKLNFIYEEFNLQLFIIEYSWEKLERETREIFKAFKAAQKKKRAFNTLSDS